MFLFLSMIDVNHNFDPVFPFALPIISTGDHHGQTSGASALIVALNTASLFSRKLLTPSSLSLELNNAHITFESNRWLSSAEFGPRQMRSLINAQLTLDVFVEISSAISNAFGSTLSLESTISENSPDRRGSVAGYTAPVVTKCIVLEYPRSLGRK